MEIYGKRLRIFLVLKFIKKFFLFFFIFILLFKIGLGQTKCHYDNAIKRGYVESTIYDLEGIYKLTKLHWSGFHNINHFIGFQIASSQSISGLLSSPEFYGNEFNNDFIIVPPDEVYKFNQDKNPHKNIRYFKYRIYLASCEEGGSPFLNKISIYYSK